MLGLALAGALGSAAGTALGNAVMGNQKNALLEEAIFDIKQSTKYKAGLYRDAQKVVRQGAQFQATVFRQAGEIAEMTAESNIAADEAALRREEDATGRQLNDLMGKNTNAAAVNGALLSSKSTLIVQNQVLNEVSRTVAQQRNDQLNKANSDRYEAALTKMQYENEARATLYSAEVTAMQYENEARAIEYEGAQQIYKMETGNSNTGSSSVGQSAIAGGMRGFLMGL